MRIKLRKPRGVLVHPNHPELQFDVERPPASEVVGFQEKIKEYERVEVAVHPKTGEVLRNADGSLEYINLTPIYPLSVITDFLGKYVKNIRGLSDEEGRMLAYTDDTKEGIIKMFLEPEFIVTEKNPLAETDAKADKEIKRFCTQWLVTGISKEETYRPLEVTGSSMPASEDSETPPTSVETVS